MLAITESIPCDLHNKYNENRPERIPKAQVAMLRRRFQLVVKQWRLITNQPAYADREKESEARVEGRMQPNRASVTGI